MKISPSTANFFRAFINMQERSESITSQRKNGYLNELHSRNLHISRHLNDEKVDIQAGNVDIESALLEKGNNFSAKTAVHIHRLFEKFGFDKVFGRSAVMELLELKGSGASKLLSNLVQADIIEPVAGYGKGKYKFKK